MLQLWSALRASRYPQSWARAGAERVSLTSPMLVTELGMATLVRLELSPNALCTRGATTRFSAVSPSRHHEAHKAGCVQGAGGESLTTPILATEAPMVRLVRLEHP